MKFKKNVDLFDFLYYRRLSGLLTLALAKTSISPNAVSAISLFISAIVAALFSSWNKSAVLLGVLFLQIARIFDCSDGELARLKEAASEFGWWLDIVLDRLKNILVYTGLTIGCYRMDGDPKILVFGMLALSNMLLSGFMVSIKSKLSFMENVSAVSLTKRVYIGGESTHIFILSLAVLFNLTGYFLLFYATAGACLWIGQFYLVVKKWKIQ